MPLAERLRVGAKLAGLLAVLALCYPPHLLHRLVSRRPSPWVGRFLGLVGRIAGLHIRSEGQASRAPVLYLANHLSWLDILILGGRCGSAFVSKAEVSRWPVIGWLARTGEALFVERTERTSVGTQAQKLAAAIARGRPLTLFPEGTTGDGSTLLPFRSSLLSAVAGTALPVQPVAIRYADPLSVRWPEGEAAGANALRLLRRRGPVAVTLVFCEPIDCSARDRKTIAMIAQRAIASALTGR